MTGGPDGYPLLGMLPQLIRNPMKVLAHNATAYGDIIPFRVMGTSFIQLNHPDLIRYVLADNHRNYIKSDLYIRFESAGGKGLLTSNGEKWRRDRQKIQPMFNRQQVEGYYFEIIREVAEKSRQRWLSMTRNGAVELDIAAEMSAITIEVILKSIYGRENLSDETMASLHHAFGVMMEYLKDVRVLARVDLEQVFRTPRYRRYRKELDYLAGVLADLTAKYRRGELTDKYNMLALLLEAQKQDPEHFSDEEVRDQSITMVFAGFETTSVVMMWMWYVLDTRPDIAARLREEIHAQGEGALPPSRLFALPYLDAVFRETMRLYPPFWGSSRQLLDDDMFGDYPVKKGTVVIVPQMVMHRHPRFWDAPNAFVPERFMGHEEMDGGRYFPFSLGPRKCIGYRFAELEAKVVMSALLPLFTVKAVNTLANGFDYGISLKLQAPLRMEIRRCG